MRPGWLWSSRYLPPIALNKGPVAAKTVLEHLAEHLLQEIGKHVLSERRIMRDQVGDHLGHNHLEIFINDRVSGFHPLKSRSGAR